MIEISLLDTAVNCSILVVAEAVFSITAQALRADSPASLASSYRGVVNLSQQLI